MIYVTGGASLLPGLITRLTSTLQPVLAYQSAFNVCASARGSEADDPRLNAWKGMSEWSRTEEFGRALITKRDYEEFGGEVSLALPSFLCSRVQLLLKECFGC
jgi:actin-related protein 5